MWVAAGYPVLITAIVALWAAYGKSNEMLLKERHSSEQVIKIASCCQSITGITLVCLTLLGLTNLFVAVLFSFLFLACQGFIFPNATALALAPLGHNAGNASALIGAIQMTIGASASAIISVFQNHTALPMAGVMTCCAVAAFSAFTIGRKVLIKNVAYKMLKQQDVELAGAL